MYLDALRGTIVTNKTVFPYFWKCAHSPHCICNFSTLADDIFILLAMYNVVIAQAWRSQVGEQMSRLNWSEWSWWVEVEVESLIGESWLVKLGLHPPTIHKPQLPHFASFNNHPAPSPPSHSHHAIPTIHTLLLPSSTIPTIHKPRHHPAPPIPTIYGLTTSFQNKVVSKTHYSVILWKSIFTWYFALHFTLVYNQRGGRNALVWVSESKAKI